MLLVHDDDFVPLAGLYDSTVSRRVINLVCRYIDVSHLAASSSPTRCNVKPPPNPQANPPLRSDW